MSKAAADAKAAPLDPRSEVPPSDRLNSVADYTPEELAELEKLDREEKAKAAGETKAAGEELLGGLGEKVPESSTADAAPHVG